MGAGPETSLCGTRRGQTQQSPRETLCPDKGPGTPQPTHLRLSSLQSGIASFSGPVRTAWHSPAWGLPRGRSLLGGGYKAVWRPESSGSSDHFTRQNVLTFFLPPACCATLGERGHLSGPLCSPLRQVGSSTRLTSFPSGAPRKVVALLAMVTLTQADCALGHRVQSPAGSPALPQPPSPGSQLPGLKERTASWGGGSPDVGTAPATLYGRMAFLPVSPVQEMVLGNILATPVQTGVIRHRNSPESTPRHLSLSPHPSVSLLTLSFPWFGGFLMCGTPCIAGVGSPPAGTPEP